MGIHYMGCALDCSVEYMAGLWDSSLSHSSRPTSSLRQVTRTSSARASRVSAARLRCPRAPAIRASPPAPRWKCPMPVPLAQAGVRSQRFLSAARVEERDQHGAWGADGLIGSNRVCSPRSEITHLRPGASEFLASL